MTPPKILERVTISIKVLKPYLIQGRKDYGQTLSNESLFLKILLYFSLIIIIKESEKIKFKVRTYVLFRTLS